MNIYELAREADIDWHKHWPIDGETNTLEVFAKLVAAHEREECAKVCEEPGWNAANWCAKAIRARSNT